MPVQQCKRDGKSGYKWGNEGFCYTGSQSKELALRQGRAIQQSKTDKSKGKSS